jgi:electron transfer flavoprotein alpha subunit
MWRQQGRLTVLSSGYNLQKHLLGGQIASTRGLVEDGWVHFTKQIGLSGRTVKPKLIITCGVSGAVQFTAGMSGADSIIAINTDKNAPIFKIAHYGIVGDLYEIVPAMIERIKQEVKIYAV